MGKQEMKDLSLVSHFVYNCRKCGLCGSKFTARVPYVCPVKESTGGFEHSTARGKIILAQGLLEGAIRPSRELAEIIYTCTLCGNCQIQCGSIDNSTGLPLVDTTQVIEAMRADLLREHPELVDQAYQTMFNSTRQYANPWGLPRTVKERWAKGLSLKDARKELHEVLLFTGCTIPSNPSLVTRAQKAALILQKAGVDFAVLGKNEPCCGSVQKRVGALDLAQEMKEKNITLLNSLGSSTIVTLCAGCYHTLKNDYQAGETPLKPEVYHFVEFLSQLIKKEKLAFTKKKSLTVTYHDPCHLGRMMKVFDPPREILKALPGITLVERAASRENTICCGAGGGMRLFGSGILAEEIGKAAVQAARDAGAEAVVTACPFCELNLDAAARQSGSSLAVYDITDLVSEWSGIEE
ncbi:MAG: (Fe-S)-binding protein [Proteobacteria bacterium]|nr:(Fe-S)-binding protein [Pseudomonadota bacterium]